jgi:2-polyprenyl-6-hydroxyphenyl methylase/3-demethylubiquinone-9 3-methyltransferase
MLYEFAYGMRLRLSGKSMATYIASYQSNRGMDFDHDVHDWLGGYPYESMSAAEVDRALKELCLQHVRSFSVKSWVHRTGVFGSGCDEYVYRFLEERPSQSRPA